MAFPITIPSSQRQAFSDLARLNPGDYKALLEHLGRTKSAVEAESFIRRLPESLTTPLSSAPRIVAALLSLRALLDRFQPPLDELVDGLVADAQLARIIEKGESATFRDRVRELLVTDGLALSAKAFFLGSLHPAPFGSARIVSDIRPIFAPSGDPMSVSGSILMHILQIESPSAEDHFSALSTRDLLKLRDTVARALEKDRQIRTMLKETPFACIDDIEG